MKTVLIYLPNLNCGGAESVTVRFANYLADNGYLVKLVTSIGDGILKSSLNSKIEHTSLGLKNQWYTLFKMPSIIKKTQPDIIFTTMKESCFIMILSKYLGLSKAKMVIREANTISLQLREENKFHQKIKNYFIKKSYHFADEIIALSEEIKTDLIKTFKISKKINVIPNPIDFHRIAVAVNEPTDKRLIIDKRTLKIVTVARLYPQKNHLFMVEAIAEYIKKYGDVKWYLVGDGPLHDTIKVKADELGILDNVIFMGFQKNPISIVNSCDIFVLPSLYEGFSNALLEAAALNKKIMVSDTQTTSVAFLKKLETGISYQSNCINDFCDKLKTLTTKNDSNDISLRMRNIYDESIIFDSYMLLMSN